MTKNMLVSMVANYAHEHSTHSRSFGIRYIAGSRSTAEFNTPLLKSLILGRDQHMQAVQIPPRATAPCQVLGI